MICPACHNEIWREPHNCTDGPPKSSILAFEIADAIVNDGGYADDPEEADTRAAERDRLVPIIKTAIEEEKPMKRYAIVRNARSRSEAEAYLPDNYRVIHEAEWDLYERGEWSGIVAERPSPPRGLAFVIEGEDDSGWTLDDYVIPRYASGLIHAEEIDLSHPIMREIPLNRRSEVANYKIEISVSDVADGDIDTLVETIMHEYGEDFDAALGDFTIRVSKAEGATWFPYEPSGENV